MQKIWTILKIVYSYVLFWTFPTPEETFYTIKGNYFTDLGWYNRAIQNFKKALKQSNDLRIHAMIGYCYSQTGGDKEAIEYYRKAQNKTREHSMSFICKRRFLRVKIDMVTLCQLRCIMCHFTNPDFVVDHTSMSDELLQKVASELFPRAHDVTLSSSAEPLLASNLHFALDLCKQYDVPNFHFSTNGIALEKKIIDKIIEVQMPVLTISVDAATKATYESIRPPAKWEHLLSRFDLIRERKRIKKSIFPSLAVTAVLMQRNIREMPDLVRLMKIKGVSHMSFVHIFDLKAPAFEGESLVNNPKLFNDTLTEISTIAAKEKIAITLPPRMPEQTHHTKILKEQDTIAAESIKQNKDQLINNHVAEFINQKNREFLLAVKEKDQHKRRCYFPWYYIHVFPNGTVFPCGFWFEFTPFGSLKTQTFREIWIGDKYHNLRNQILKMNLRETCEKCPMMNMGWQK
jgi:radical SAM protein with 4Fe4S-binding SPASM domain